MKRLFSAKRGLYALDDCSDFDGSVVVGDGQLLHYGWLHPYPLGAGHHRGPGTPHSGSQRGLNGSPVHRRFNCRAGHSLQTM